MNSKDPTSSSNALLEITKVFSLADSITINDDPQSPPVSKIQKNTKEKSAHLIPTNVPLQSEHRGAGRRNSDDPYEVHAAEDPVFSQTTSTAVPNASTAVPVTCSSVPKISVPEVIDVDEEDLDDCKLVKIDLSQRKFPFAKKFQNTEVICLAEDSDEGETEASACHASKSSREKCGNTAPVVTSTDIYIDRSGSPELDMEVDVINENISYTYPAQLPTPEIETDVIKENISEPSKSQALKQDLVKYNTCIDNVVDSMSTENRTNLVSNSIPPVTLAEKTFPHGKASHCVISSSTTLVNDADNVNPVIPIALHVNSTVADAASDVAVGGFLSLQSLPVHFSDTVVMNALYSDSQHPLKLPASQTYAAIRQKLSNLPQENAMEKSGTRLLPCKICSMAFENRLALVEHTVTCHKPKQDAVIKPEVSLSELTASSCKSKEDAVIRPELLHVEHTVCSHKFSRFPILMTRLRKSNDFKSTSNGLKNTSLPPVMTTSGVENASHAIIVGDNLITAHSRPENLTTTLPKTNVHPVECHKENEPENSYNSSHQIEGPGSSMTHYKSLTGSGQTEGSTTHYKSLTGSGQTEGSTTHYKSLTGSVQTEGSKTHYKSLTGSVQTEGSKTHYKSLTGSGQTEGSTTHYKSLTGSVQTEGSMTHYKSLTGSVQTEGSKTHYKSLTGSVQTEGSKTHYKSLTGSGQTEGSKTHYKSLTDPGQTEGPSTSKTIQEKSLPGTGQADSCVKTPPDVLQEDIKINCPSCHYPFGTTAERNEHLVREKKCAHVLSSFCACCSLHLSSAAEKERHLLNFDECMVQELVLKIKMNEKIESPSLKKNSPVEKPQSATEQRSSNQQTLPVSSGPTAHPPQKKPQPATEQRSSNQQTLPVSSGPTAHPPQKKPQPATEQRSSNQQTLPVSSGLTAHPPQKKPPAIKIAFRRSAKLHKPRSEIPVEKTNKSKNTITSATGLVSDKKCVSPVNLGIHTSNQTSQQAIHTQQAEPCKMKNLKIVLQHVSVMCKVCKKTFKDSFEFSKHQDISEACKQKECVESEVLVSPSPKNCLPNLSSSSLCAEQGAVPAPPLVESDLEFSSEEDVSSYSSSSEAGTVEYKCKICKNLFSHKSSFKKHVKTHNPHIAEKKQAKKMRCKCCTRKFTDDTALQAHLLKRRFCFLNVTKAYMNHSVDFFNCGMCGKVYPTAKDLRKHGFRDMTCRLRLVDLVLKEYKAKAGTPAIPSSSTEQVLPDTTVSSSSKDPPAVQCDSISSDLPATEHTASINPLADQRSTSSNSRVSQPDTVSCDPPAIQHNTISSDLNVLDKKQESSPSTSNPANENSANRNVCKSCGKSFLILNFRYHLLSSRACYKYYDEHRTECPKHLAFCFECKRGFKSLKDFYTHKCVPFDVCCSSCGQGFKLKSHLRMHLAKFAFCRQALSKAKLEPTAQGSLKSASSDSNTVASTLPELQAVSVVADTYTCLLCKAEFPNHKELLEHSYQHTEEKPYQCSRCSVTFFHFNRLVSHDGFHRRMDKEARLSAEATHKDSALTDVKPAIIKQDLSSPDGAARDLSRPAENSYSCLVCQESFNMFHQFKVHVRKHSRTSFYSCSICLKKFATQDALNHHVKQHEQPRAGVKRKSITVKALEQSANVVEQSSSAVEQSGNVVERSGSVVKRSGSVVEQSGSVVEQSHRGEDESTSEVEQQSAVEMPASATENSTVCAKPSLSPTQKRKHLDDGAGCSQGKSLKLTSSLYGCLYCQHYFPSDQEKRKHMIESKACKDQMKNTFDNKLYTYANRDSGQNSKLCVFCGGHFANMFAHLLDSTCFQTLEQSVIDHRKLEKLGVKAETCADVAKPAGSLPAFPCIVCKRSFEKEGFLKQHIKKHMSMFKNELTDIEGDIAFDEHLYCHICLKYLKTVNFVKQHVLLGHCTKPISRSVYQNVVCKAGAYWCNICDIKFESSKYDDLITHMYEKHNEGTSKLLSVFNRLSGSLKAQLKKAAKQPSKFSCTLCGITILTTGKRAHYNMHVKRVLAELKSRPISSEVICPICQHSFNSAKGLKRHLQRHDMNDIADANVGANVFCRICKKHFSSSELLKAHVETCHLIELSCNYCDGIFSTKRTLRRHISRVHKELNIAENEKNSDQTGGSTVGMDQVNGSNVDSIASSIVKKESKNCDDHDLSNPHPCQQGDQSSQGAAALKLHTVDIDQKQAPGPEPLRDNLSHGKLDTIKSVEQIKTNSISQVKKDLEGESSSLAKGNSVKCSVCLKAVSAVEYYDHLSGLHNWTADTNYTCSFCHVRFPYKYLLNEHTIQCKSNFQCKLCDRKNLQNLRTHVIHFHKYDWNSYISQFTVPIIAIDNGGLEISNLGVGLVPQSSLKVCGLCGVGYTQLSEYTTHIHTHIKRCSVKLHALDQPEDTRHDPPSAETSEQGQASDCDSVPAASAEILPSEQHGKLGPADTTPALMNTCHPELNYDLTNEISAQGDIAEALDENSLETVAPSLWDSESSSTEDNIASSMNTESPDSQETIAPSVITESPDSQETVAHSFWDSESPCSKDNIAPSFLTESPDTPEYVAPPVCNPACPDPQEEIVTVAQEKAPSKKREMCSEDPLPSKKQKLLSNGHIDYQFDDLPELVIEKQNEDTPVPKNDLELPDFVFKKQPADTSLPDSSPDNFLDDPPELVIEKQNADTPALKNDLGLPDFVFRKQPADTSLPDSSPDNFLFSGTCDPQTRNVFQVFTESGATNTTRHVEAIPTKPLQESIPTKPLQGDLSTGGEKTLNKNSHPSVVICNQERNVFNSIHI
ncbi:uncharacterized protein LOC131948051 [Physella acuta]|uniref:uncharacterized protein LOC131948051 n=1 Tax=Physella acuta TaxID=109671 RepID=UPI0027DB2918|nr:uncharacterized protein LOC131948051 [Physella acuta]XP_059165501.1 uncharacterized protein LOC131948051 [Physella acuta]XP_059165502.1 uncharacterized protein LOC131948051 [Physella acuta]XP_059165503.1 uncharacterized protein LOC131948051 [Physella acuta]